MSIRAIRNIAIGICVIVVSLCSLLAVHQHYFMQQARIERIQKEEALTALTKEIKGIEEALALYEKEKENFAKLLFKERDIPAFLEKISEVGKSAQVTIVDMQTRRFQEVIVPATKTNRNTASGREPDPVQEKKQELKRVLTLAAMPIDIKVEGTFASLADFLDQLQNYEQLLSISEVKLSSNTEYPMLNCQFTLRVYSLKALEDLKNI